MTKRRGLRIAAVLVGVCVVVAGCGHRTARSANTSYTTTTTVAPIGEVMLKKLLLAADEINEIMGASEMQITDRRNELSDDSDETEPRECLPIDSAGQRLVYENTGYIKTGVRGQVVRERDVAVHYVDQVAVLFPTAGKATTFLHIQSELWPSCHRYTHTQSGSEWVPGPVTEENDVLSVTADQQNPGQSSWAACSRALTARNNVVVDVNTCGADPGASAVIIATQIADKVPMD